jgi:hypothetical protein
MAESEIPADLLSTAERTLDLVLCNCREAGDVRQDSIRDIARALLAERERCRALTAVITESQIREILRAVAEDQNAWCDDYPDDLFGYDGEIDPKFFADRINELIAAAIRQDNPNEM